MMSCTRTSMKGKRKPAAKQSSAMVRCPNLNAITIPSTIVISRQTAIAMTAHWSAGEVSVEGLPDLRRMLMWMVEISNSNEFPRLL